jgi:hypothetical protein
MFLGPSSRSAQVNATDSPSGDNAGNCSQPPCAVSGWIFRSTNSGASRLLSATHPAAAIATEHSASVASQMRRFPYLIAPGTTASKIWGVWGSSSARATSSALGRAESSLANIALTRESRCGGTEGLTEAGEHGSFVSMACMASSGELAGKASLQVASS